MSKTTQLPGIPRGAPIFKQVRDALVSCPFCGAKASLELHNHGAFEIVTHFSIGCSDSECVGAADLCAHPIEKLQQHLTSWNGRVDQATIDVAKHFEQFVGFAATCQRENTYDWMCLFLDWLNGAATRLEPGSYFELKGSRFVLRRPST